MIKKSVSYELNTTLSLQTPDSLISISTKSLTITLEESLVKECLLVFTVSSEQFQYFQFQQLFNLKSEINNAVKKSFQADLEIELVAKLHPQCLSELSNNLVTLKEYFLSLNNQHPVLKTENWFIVSGKQPQAEGEVSYQTLWNYLDPGAVAALSGETLVDSVIRFMQEQTDTDLEVVGVVSEAMKDWLKKYPDVTNIAGITNEEIANNILSIMKLVDAKPTVIISEYQLFVLVLQFFQDNDWSYEIVKENTILRLPVQANNGEWFCYAEIREEQQQFRFYSVCPVKAPPEKRLAISEFITRANYGLSIGNFELDFTDGEVRYKTSIDVEGSQLDPALIKQLVYHNVMTMDEYLPGIMKTIYSDVTSEEAITEIEGT